MIRSTLVALALLGAPAIVVAQSPMQGQAPAADTSKAKPAAKGAKKGAKKSGNKKHKPAAKPDSAAKM